MSTQNTASQAVSLENIAAKSELENHVRLQQSQKDFVQWLDALETESGTRHFEFQHIR